MNVNKKVVLAGVSVAAVAPVTSMAAVDTTVIDAALVSIIADAAAVSTAIMPYALGVIGVGILFKIVTRFSRKVG